VSNPRHLRDERGEVLLREEERQPVECWSRVMGYLRPIRTMDGQVMWNAGKVSEFRDRKMFTVTDAQRLEV
jgi:anaerobic ribonucleoside-triphosphate reductase